MGLCQACYIEAHSVCWAKETAKYVCSCMVCKLKAAD